MLWKKFVKDYLSFSRRDRLGLMALLLLILFMYLAPRLFIKDKQLSLQPIQWQKTADSLQAGLAGDSSRDETSPPGVYSPPEKTGPHRLFRFDPNSLDAAGWQALGLSERTSLTIIKFRDRGGRFYRSEDLKKIWGLPPGFYERVKDSIIIAEHRIVVTYEPKETSNTPARMPRTIIDINTADSAAFESLPGIGAKLAARIISFRNALGGFHSVTQLREIYGIRDSVFEKIQPLVTVQAAHLQKLDINRAEKEVLARHPYLKWKLAQAIIAYRQEHGPFKSAEDLKKLAAMDENTYLKILPYLIFHE